MFKKNNFLIFISLFTIFFTKNIFSMYEPFDIEKIGSNFHQVDTNLYRSGIVYDEKEYKKILDNLKIKMVISFTKKTWNKEVKIIDQRDGTLLKFLSLEANKHPNVGSVIELIEILGKYLSDGNAIWIHDKDGANRTGLASALYVIFLEENLTNEQRLKKARDHFSWWKYGYLSGPQHWFNSTNVMDYSLNLANCYFDFYKMIKEEELKLEEIIIGDQGRAKLNDEKLTELQEEIGIKGFPNILTDAIAIYDFLNPHSLSGQE